MAGVLLYLVGRQAFETRPFPGGSIFRRVCVKMFSGKIRMYVGTRVVLFALGALLMPHLAAAQDAVVEMVVLNRTASAVTVFVQWRNGARVRLGELGRRDSETFTTPYRGQEFALSLDVLGAPSRGTRGGAFTFGDDRGRDGSSGTFVSVEAGDRIEWEIRTVEPVDVFYRRLGSVAGDVELREPRVSRYTAMSALRIQEAQGTEDEVRQEQSYRRALEVIYDGLENEDDNPEAYLHLGIVHTGLGNYLAADSAFDHAEAMYPDYVDLPEGGTGAYRFNGWVQAYNEAVVRIDLEDPEGALELYRSANVMYDQRPEAYLNIGSQTAGTGDLEASIDAWRSAIAVIESPDADPGDDETRESWNTTFWTMAHTNLGQVLEMAGRTEEAVPVYQALLERDPGNAQAQSSLALALAQTGQGDDALSIFDEIIARDDASALDYFNAGVSLYIADQLEKAVLGFEKAVERAPMYRDALQNLAQSLSVLEDYEAQVPYSTRLLELDPYNEYGYQMHVRALAQVGLQTDLVTALDFLRELPFGIDNLQLAPGTTGASLSGVAINKTLPPGTSLTLRFTYYDIAGNPLGTQDTEVTISDPDVAHPFSLTFEADVQVLGYGYEFVN